MRDEPRVESEDWVDKSLEDAEDLDDLVAFACA